VARSLPELVVTNNELAAMVDTSDEWIKTRTGIETRYISRGETVSSLSADVFRKLCAAAGYSPCDVDLLILATVTPEYLTPSSATFVLGDVGAKNAFGFDINAACSSFVYAMSVADKMICSGVYKNAVVISSDLLSKITDWNDRSTCILFGDGAGGVLIEACEGGPCIIAEDLHTDGQYTGALRGWRLPLRNAWHEDGGADEPYIVMDGKAIFDFVTTKIPLSIRAVLEKAKMTMDDIKHVVCHQANARLIEGVAKKLKMSIEKFYISIGRYGNTSSSSMPIALSEMMEKGIIEKGDKVVISGFGAGVTWGTVLVQF
jgi:3-oxoacyl-[acyl-carrier-protein] synthase-3